MHPRWLHGTAAARPPAPGRPPLPRPPAPCPPRPGRRWSSAGHIVLLAAAAALLAGCGHSGTPAGTKAAGTKAVSHPAAPCGSAKTPANVPVRIEVAKGKVACPEAMTIERAYTSAVARGRAPGNGRGPVQVSGWKCQAFTTPVSLKTGDVSACYRSGAEILAVLPPP